MVDFKTKNKGNVIFALSIILLAICTIVHLLWPLSLQAEERTGTFGDFTVTYSDGGAVPTFEQATGVLTINQTGMYTIANTNPAEATIDRILVTAPNCTINLAGVNIANTNDDMCALELATGGTTNTTINLVAGKTNTLKSGKDCAGLQTTGTCQVTITTDATGNQTPGVLNATGGFSGAGIGGDYAYRNTSTGTVTINGGSIVATGGDYGAGIGGGFVYDNKSTGIVTINGGSVVAKSSAYGAGIGGGAAQNSESISTGTVTITGGSIVATGGDSGAGIGGGNSGNLSNGTVYISGGSVKATKGDGARDNIGAGSSTTSNYSKTLKDNADGADVTLYTLTVQEADGTATSNALLTGFSTNTAQSYGVNDMKTDDDGKIYVYVPEGATSATATIAGKEYKNETAADFEDKTAKLDAPPIKMTGITLENDSLDYGATTSLEPTIAPEDAANKALTWDSEGTGNVKFYSDNTCTNQITGETAHEGTVYIKAVVAGECTITATAADGGGASGTCTLTINKATPTVSFNNNSKTATYNGNVQGLFVPDELEVTGVDGSEIEYSVDFTYYTDETCTTQTTTASDGATSTGGAPKSSGTYYVKATVAPLGYDAINYKEATTSDCGTLTINEKSLTISGLAIADKQYDGTNTARIFGTPSLEGAVLNDDVSLSIPYPTATFTGDDFGQNATFASPANIPVTFSADFTLSGDDAGNYSLTQPTGITGKIVNNYTATKGEEYTVNSDNWITSSTDSGNFVINAEDGYKISTTNTVDGSWSDTLEYTEETGAGTAAFYVKRNSDGAISNSVTETYKIDTTAPSNITISYFKGDTATVSANFITNGVYDLIFGEEITVKITATDAMSGVKTFSYTPTYGPNANSPQEINATRVSGTTNYYATFKIEPQFKGQIIDVKATDNAGNDRETTYTTKFIIDENTPEAPIIVVETVDDEGTNATNYDGTYWTNENIRFTIEAPSSLSGISKYQYSTDGTSWSDLSNKDNDNMKIINRITNADGDNPKTVATTMLLKGDQDAKEYKFRAISNPKVAFDENGNPKTGNGATQTFDGQVTDAITVKIDKTIPTISVSGNISDYLLEDTVRITTSVGLSGIKKVQVQKNDGAWDEITKINDKYEYKVTENATYKFKIVNNANVESTVESLTYTKLDGTKPIIEINANFAEDGNGDTYTSGTWCKIENSTIYLTPEDTSGTLGNTKFQYKIIDNLDESNNSNNWIDYNSTIQISTDCNLTYTFKATSESGNESEEKSFTIKRDTVASSNPTLKIKEQPPAGIHLIDAISPPIATFVGVLNKDQVLSIETTDATSGIKSIKYTQQITDINGNKGGETSGEITLNSVDLVPGADVKAEIGIPKLDNGSRCSYAITIVDNAGNETKAIAIFETDLTAPKITGIENEKTYYATREIEIEDLNIKEIKINGASLSLETIQEDIDGVTFERAKSKRVITLVGDQTITYTIVVTDLLGVETTYTVDMKEISTLADSIEDITTENTKSNDISKLEDLENLINTELNTKEITDSEKTELKEILNKTTTLLETIDTNLKIVQNLTDELDKYNKEEVKSDDKETLISLKEQIQTLIDSSNYNESEKTEMTELVNKTDRLIETIDSNLENEQVVGDKLVEGDNQEIKVGSDVDITFRIDEDFNNFEGLYLNGNLVNQSNYEAKEGSVIITLKSDYVKTLPVGRYEFIVAFTKGEATLNLIVNPDSINAGADDKQETTETTDTGDSSNMMLYIILALASLGGLGTVIYKSKTSK